MLSEAWVALLRAQYNKLPEAFKESFVNFALSMAKEAEGQNPEKKTGETPGGERASRYG